LVLPCSLVTLHGLLCQLCCYFSCAAAVLLQEAFLPPPKEILQQLQQQPKHTPSSLSAVGTEQGPDVIRPPALPPTTGSSDGLMVDMLSQQLLSSAMQQQLVHPPVTPGRSGNHLYTAAPFQVGGTSATFLIFLWSYIMLCQCYSLPGHCLASTALETCRRTFSSCFYTGACQAGKRLPSLLQDSRVAGPRHSLSHASCSDPCITCLQHRCCLGTPVWSSSPTSSVPVSASTSSAWPQTSCSPQSWALLTCPSTLDQAALMGTR